MKAQDAFDLQAFLSHCEAARMRIPLSEATLEELIGGLRAAYQARREALSPWDKLGIDWDDFHPRAREILDDPFFWDCSNDFSPNGNDTGADLLENYRDWRRTHATASPIRFLEDLSIQWGYSSMGSMDEETRDEAIIALAFADIKLRSVCDKQVRELALEAVGRQRSHAENSDGWAYKDERLNALKKIGQKLQ